MTHLVEDAPLQIHLQAVQVPTGEGVLQKAQRTLCVPHISIWLLLIRQIGMIALRTPR